MTLSRAATGHALILHACGSLAGQGAYLFLSRSGGGKSTVAALCDGLGVPVLCDDGALVLEKDSRFYLCPLPRQAGLVPATPPLGDGTRVRRTFFLAKATDPKVEAVPPLHAVARCLKEHVVFGFAEANPLERRMLLDRLIRLFRTVPAYVLHFRKDNSFWKVIDELEEREEAERART